MKKLFLSSLMAIASATCFNAAAELTQYTFTGSGIGPGGVPVSISSFFDFDNVNKTLTIVLKNTSPSNEGQDVPGSTLSGVYWNFKDNLNPTLVPISAYVSSSSSIVGTCSNLVNCALLNNVNVGGEFGYAYQATGLPAGADRGIASSGYLTTGLPENIGNFNGINLDNPDSLDGINFGLVSASSGYNPNGGLESVPVIQDSVVFKLSYASNLNLSILDIALVNYQFGTSFSELNVLDAPIPVNVPEPSSLALLGLALGGLGWARGKSQLHL